MNSEFERHTLSKLVHIDQKSLGKKTPEDFTFSYISLSDVSSGNISKTLEKHSFKSAPLRARRVLQNGDIIMATVRPNLQGFAKITEEFSHCVASTGFAVLSPKDNVSGEFIYQCLYSYQITKQIESLVVGSNYPAINSSDVAGLHIYTPPYPEQRKIAKILSTWDKAISTTERLIDNSKQQKKALMQQLLTGKKRLLDDSGKPFEGEWETAMLSDIGKVFIGLVTTMTKYYVDDGIPLIRNSDIKPNTIDKTKMLQLCSDFSNDYDNRKLRKGDIVTVHTGEVGVSSVIDDELDGCIGFATLNTRPKTLKVNAEYLSWYFNSERFINWCVSMSTGDGRRNLNLKDFVKAKVLLPSLEEQQKIVSVLKNADKEIDILEKQLADLKQEKKALMQQLLTGKRRVKVDDKEVA